MKLSDIRAKARLDLGNSIFSNAWMLGLAILFATGAILGACTSTILGYLLLMGPLTVGVSKYFLLKARNDETAKFETAFSGFNNFSENFLLGLMITLFEILWSLLFLIPGIVKSYAYSMSFYIKVDHPEYDWQRCMDESQEMMRGHKAELFLLDLSFIGWFILGALACGVGIFWVLPYSTASRANFYETLRAGA